MGLIVFDKKFFVGVDLGQMQDYTAIAVVEKVDEGAELRLRHLERLPLTTSYPGIVKHVGGLMRQQPLRENSELVVDATGVGRPVVDMFENAGLEPIAVTITGGDIATQENKNHRVPKRDLVIGLQVLLQEGRLKIAESLPDSQTLVRELLAFRVKIDPVTAHDTYNAREGAHDDLVLAAALACWRAQTFVPGWILSA